MNMKNQQEIVKKVLGSVLLAVVLIFSFILSFKAGERGFFPYGQSFVFDGSYRLFQGQIPFKDFVLPTGPVPGWFLIPFFRFLGVNYFSYIAGAASVNVLATLCSFLVLRFLFPKKTILAFLAAVLTAIWFYPPNGTPYEDQTSFFLSLLGVAFVLTAMSSSVPKVISGFLPRILFLVFSGCCAAFSIITKQNAGLFFLPVFFFLIFTIQKTRGFVLSRSWVYFGLGFILSLSFFLLWIYVKADMALFVQYFLRLPAGEGWERFLSSQFRSPIHIFSTRAPSAFITGLAVSGLGIFFRFLINFYRSCQNKSFSREDFLPFVLGIGLIVFQYIYQRSTFNVDESSFPFVGIISAIAIGSFFSFFKGSRREFLFILSIILSALWIFYASFHGIRVSLNRKVMLYGPGFAFSKPLNLKGLEHLKLGTSEFSDASPRYIKEEDLAGLCRYLSEKKENFFIFPDVTILYGLMNVPSPQPLLIFHKGLSYPRQYDAGLDQWIVRDLRKNKVSIVILQKYHFSGSLANLDDFPKLKFYIKENFTKIQEIGNFDIYEKVWV